MGGPIWGGRCCRPGWTVRLGPFSQPPWFTNTLGLVPKSEPLFLSHPTVGLERPTQLRLEVAWEMVVGGCGWLG